MRILLVYDYLSEIGGVERVMATHARWLMKRGHEVVLLFNYVDPAAKEYAFLKNLDIRETSTWKGGESLRLFSALFGKNNLKKYQKADLVISYSFPSLFTSRIIKKKKIFYYLPMEFVYFPLKKKLEWANDLKRKITIFGSLFISSFLKRLDKKLIKNLLVVANSEFTQREIQERYQKDSFISYPPLNPIFEPKSIDRNILKKYGINKKFLLTSGRIIPDKKTAWLIEVFSKLEGDFEFVIAGGIGIQHRKELEELAQKKGISDKIKILGVIDQSDLVGLYSACEAFLFASPKEAFGLAPIEAVACGTPIIAWGDGAGPSEYVLDGENGFLAKPYNLKDFEVKLTHVLATNFKRKNNTKILESIRKFKEKEQYKQFISRVETYSK